MYIFFTCQRYRDRLKKCCRKDYFHTFDVIERYSWFLCDNNIDASYFV